MAENFQQYFTPSALANKAWSKFKNREFVRVLEPSAGEGNLLDARPEYCFRENIIDCCEIDISRHGILKEKCFSVIGLDFLKLQTGAQYSHVIMNPPFSNGAEHVLKAWDLLWDGEIVAILNAETIKNPYSKERRLLVSLIEKNGEVEFIANAFLTEDAKQKTEVEIALIYLKKTAREDPEYIESIWKGLDQDHEMFGHDGDHSYLAIPNSFIENSVKIFNAAVRAVKNAVIAGDYCRYYENLLGKPFAELRDKPEQVNGFMFNSATIQEEFLSKYDKLKDRAWANLLHSTEFTGKVSASAAKKIESQFESIKKLEYTGENILGFLRGLVENQSQIQIDMICEVFDMITKYHSDNTVFYMGWKSNDKHISCARRVKKSRFIIPVNFQWQYLNHSDRLMLQDFDKAFALLHQKECDYSISNLFSRGNGPDGGEKISTTYFDIRFYPGVGTIHFYPKSVDIVEKLNRYVGHYRKWLPSEKNSANDEFWHQYQYAEKYQKELRSEVKRLDRDNGISCWSNDSLWYACKEHEFSGEKEERSHMTVKKAMEGVLTRRGYQVQNLLNRKPCDKVKSLPLARALVD